MTTAEIDDLFDQLFRKTLGTNVRAVRRLLGEQGGDWVLADQMAHILKLRNELAHHWMRTRAMTQQTSANRLAMLAELKQARGELEEADPVVTERTRNMLAKTDMPESFLQEEYARLIELAERGEDDPDTPSYWAQEG